MLFCNVHPPLFLSWYIEAQSTLEASTQICVNPLMLLPSIVNTPIHVSKIHLLACAPPHLVWIEPEGISVLNALDAPEIKAACHQQGCCRLENRCAWLQPILCLLAKGKLIKRLMQSVFDRKEKGVHDGSPEKLYCVEKGDIHSTDMKHKAAARPKCV